MTAISEPTLAGWLRMHALSAQTCKTLLNLTPQPMPVPDRSAPAMIPDGPTLWSRTADCLAQELPTLEGEIRKVAEQTRVDFAPDRQKYPRPFTLHIPVQGHIHVSCPLTGEAQDVLTVAHEFGHALQLTCCPKTALPPVLRETCAFVVEAVVAARPDQHDTALSRLVRAAYARRSSTDLGPVAQRLRAVLDTPQAPYDYGWNYPPARQIARRLVHGQTPPDTRILTGLFRGEATVPALASLLCGMTE